MPLRRAMAWLQLVLLSLRSFSTSAFLHPSPTMHSKLTLTALLSSLLAAEGAVESDRVTNLPGFKGELPSKHYSGYTPVGELSKTPGHLHYWFIESEGNPSEDPVVLWLNGECIAFASFCSFGDLDCCI